MPVTPRRSQELLPEATAERATTSLFSFLPAMKYSLMPEEENFEANIPMRTIITRYIIKANRECRVLVMLRKVVSPMLHAFAFVNDG